MIKRNSNNGDGQRWPQASFLGSLTEDECKSLLSLGIYRKYPRGTYLLHEGEKGNHVVIILRGIVKVSVDAETGNTVMLGIRGPGELIGEMSVLCKQPRTATAVAGIELHAQVIHNQAFIAHLDHYPGVAARIAAMMGGRLRDANMRRLEFNAYSVQGRVARVLTEVARIHGHREGGCLRIGPEITQADLASLSSVSVRSIEKVLRAFEVDGLVARRRRDLIVIDPASLDERAKSLRLPVLGGNAAYVGLAPWCQQSARERGWRAIVPGGCPLHRSQFARHLCLAIDAKGYGGRDNVGQYDLQSQLQAVLAEAAQAAGLDRSAWQRQEQGDCEVALIPPAQPEPRLVDDFVRELDASLSLLNHDRRSEARLRVRVAMHFGVAYQAPMGFAGEGVVVTARILNSPGIYEALEHETDANVVVAVSDRVYREVVLPRHTSLREGDFSPAEINAKEYAGTAWIRVLSRRLPAGESPRQGVQASGKRGTVQASPRIVNNFYEQVRDVGVIGIAMDGEKGAR